MSAQLSFISTSTLIVGLEQHNDLHSTQSGIAQSTVDDHAPCRCRAHRENMSPVVGVVDIAIVFAEKGWQADERVLGQAYRRRAVACGALVTSMGCAFHYGC